MDKVAEHFRQKDEFAKLCGIELVEIGKGYAKAQVEVGKEHLNGVGTAHGGLIFTLADLAFAAAGNSYGQVAVAVNVNISFMRPGKFGGVLTAEAKEVSATRKLANYEVNVTDESGGIIAAFSGLAYRKNVPLGM